MNKQVLFISIDGITDQLGQSQVLPYLIRLTEKGYEIGIVSCEKLSNLKKNKPIIDAITTKYNIGWHYCLYKNYIPIISQVQNFFNLKRIVNRNVKANKNIILHCRSYMPALIGLELKQKYQTKFIFDMRGFWADERIDGNIWNLKNPIHKLLYKYFKCKEIDILEKADYAVTLTNTAKTEIESWQLKKKTKIEVIPCCVDVNHFTVKSEEEKITIRKELHIEQNVYVIGYLGSMGTWYMLDEMLDFFKILQERKPTSIFFFITNDNEQDILNAAKLKGISINHLIVKSAKREDVPTYISCFDIGLFFIKPLYSKKGSSPTKLAELLACGIPIITNTGVGDVDELVLSSNCGILISSFDKKGYDTVIDKIASLNISKQHYTDIALNNFSLQRGVESYNKIYDLLADKCHSVTV